MNEVTYLTRNRKENISKNEVNKSNRKKAIFQTF